MRKHLHMQINQLRFLSVFIGFFHGIIHVKFQQLQHKEKVTCNANKSGAKVEDLLKAHFDRVPSFDVY